MLSQTQLNNIIDIQLGNVTFDHDYWCDTFIEQAWIKEGEITRRLTDDELDYIHDNYQDWLCDKIIDYLY